MPAHNLTLMVDDPDPSFSACPHCQHVTHNPGNAKLYCDGVQVGRLSYFTNTPAAAPSPSSATLLAAATFANMNTAWGYLRGLGWMLPNPARDEGGQFVYWIMGTPPGDELPVCTARMMGPALELAYVGGGGVPVQPTLVRRWAAPAVEGAV
jgi:hypothetical protein